MAYISADEFIGPAEMRRICRLHGARLLLTGHPSIWVLRVAENGWYVPRARYMRSEFTALIQAVKTNGWPAGHVDHSKNRGYDPTNDSHNWEDTRHEFLAPKRWVPMRRAELIWRDASTPRPARDMIATLTERR